MVGYRNTIKNPRVFKNHNEVMWFIKYLPFKLLSMAFFRSDPLGTWPCARTFAAYGEAHDPT